MRTLSIGGLRLTLDWAAAEHVPLREILVRGEYWPTEEYRPSQGQTVIDAGANAGVYSTVSGRLVGPTGRVIAIEPNPVVASRLRRNVEQNGLTERVTIFEAGLSDHAGTAWLYVGPNSTIGTLVLDGGMSSAGTNVELIRLDDIVDATEIPVVDVLKVDVEGSERPTLMGAGRVLRRTRRAVIEVSHRADVPGVIQACRDAGFEHVEDWMSGSDSGASIVFARRLDGSPRL